MNTYLQYCRSLALGLNGVFLAPGSLLVAFAVSQADTSPREQTEGAIVFTLIGVAGLINIWMAAHGRFRSHWAALVSTVAINLTLGTLAARQWYGDLLTWGSLLPPIPILTLTTALATGAYVTRINWPQRDLEAKRDN